MFYSHFYLKRSRKNLILHDRTALKWTALFFSDYLSFWLYNFYKMSVAKDNCIDNYFMQRDTVCSHYSHNTNNLVVVTKPTYIWNLLIQLPVSTSRTSLFRIRNNPWSMQMKYWWMNVCACGQTQKCTYTKVSTGQWNLELNNNKTILVVKYVKVGKTECNVRVLN